MNRKAVFFQMLRFIGLSCVFVFGLMTIIGTGGGGDGGGGDGDGESTLPTSIEGEAVIGLTVIDGGDALSGGTPPPEPEGYTLLPIDLNEGTGGHYVWLYYKMGPADGTQGTPISEIYTVAEIRGETPISEDDTKLSANLNGEGDQTSLWLYYSASSGFVLRCIVVANETSGVTVYGPPEAGGQYNVIWVEELDPDELKTPSTFPQPPDAQDLNEKDGFIPGSSDWIFIGYCTD